jgi:hypothetical protein
MRLTLALSLIALVAQIAGAQVGGWRLEDGTLQRKGFKKDRSGTGLTVLGIFDDGTYAAASTIMCGSTSVICEVGTWKNARRGRIKLTPSNRDEIDILLTACLFENGFIRDVNARLPRYKHTAKLDDDGNLVIRSKAKARARFVYGWKSVRGKSLIVATPTTEGQVADWLGDCFF